MERRAAFALLVALASPAVAADQPHRVDTVKIEAGFIDDPFDFSPDGKTLAYLATDGATHAELRFVEVAPADPAKRATLAVPYSSITAERMDFLDGERLLVVERNPDTRLARSQVYTRKGPTKEKLGPADDIVLATVNGIPAIVSYLRTPRGSGYAHTLVATRRSDGKPLARRVYLEGGDGRIPQAGGTLKLLWFQDGYATLIGEKEGAFDAAHDIRKPSLATRVDAFGGKQLSEHEIPDLLVWAARVQNRRKHQNEADFVQVTDDLKHLELVDAGDTTTALETPRPFHKYDPKTLQYQPLPDGNLLASLTVDPVNRDAVAAKKADKDWIDLLRVDVKARSLALVAQLDGEGRPSAWRLSGARLGVLRKHKGFARGGVELAIYELAPTAATAAAAK